jgi:hypothetical protein
MTGAGNSMPDQRGAFKCGRTARCGAVTCAMALASAPLGIAPAPGPDDPQPTCFRINTVGTCQSGMHAPPGALDCGCGDPPTVFPKFIEQHPDVCDCAPGTPGWTGCTAVLVQATYQEYACSLADPCTPVAVGNPVALGEPCDSVRRSGQTCP